MNRVTVVLASAVGVAAGAAVIATIGGSVEPGISGSDAGSTVEWVLPGSVPWRAGVRPGQEVVALAAADDPRGWSIETRSDGQRFTVSLAPATQALRGGWPAAGIAALVAAAGLIFLRRSPHWSTGSSCLAAGLASLPLSIQGDLTSSSYGAVLALVSAAAWIGLWMPRTTYRLAVVLATIALGTTWLAARLAAMESFEALETVRLVAVVGTNLSVAGALAVMIARRVRAHAPGRRWLVDLAGLTLAAAVAGALLLVETPLPILVGVGFVVAVLYPFVRRWAVGLLERLIFADMRERMSTAAVEAERARLSREMHDAPLQELAGVIKRLELLPGARSESNALRGVADQLRSVATQLYPPALDDLGLVAAIEGSVMRALETQPEIEVVLEVADQTGIRRAERPPQGVELAAFRIVHEAVANAIAHSGARLIHLSGELKQESIVLSIRDDGRGMMPGADRRALDAGHLGLVSMRRRAEAIGARLDIRSSGDGTEVRLEWQA